MSSVVFFESASEVAILTNTFSVAGVATDPTTITLIVTDPSGTAITYTYAAAEITRTGAGVYTKDIACSADGVWQYTWTGTGTASDTTVGTWTVFDTTIQRRYCSIEELKKRLSIDDANDDFEISLALEAASRNIDEICGRRFWRGTETRTFIPQDLYCVKIDDLVSLTTLKTDDSGDGVFELTWSTTDYQLLPHNPASYTETRPYTSIKAVGARTFPYYIPGVPSRDDRVQVAGVFGWPSVPLAVKQACLIMTVELLKFRSAPFGVAGFDGFGAVRVRDNPMAMRLLGPYQRYPLLVY